METLITIVDILMVVSGALVVALLASAVSERRGRSW